MEQSCETLSKIIKRLMTREYDGVFIENMISSVVTMIETNNFNGDKAMERFLMDCSVAIANTYLTTQDDEFRSDLLDAEEMIDTLLMM